MTDSQTSTDSAGDPLARLRALQAADIPVHGGRTLAYVYDSGLPDVDRVAREAVAAFAGSNGLDPTVFPSLLQMENDLVGFWLDLVDAPAEAVGTVTSGGTESCLLAVLGARDARPDVARPRLVAPTTVHPAFIKGAHYFGVEVDLVPVGPDFRIDPAAILAAVDEDPDRTVLVVVSAPSYAHGVVDPVSAIAPEVAARGIRCHVDACIGGWVLPWARRLGRDVPPWTFAVDGVTSISADLHKYGYAPKGTSLLLHRSSQLRRPQYFAHADWPGYTMLNSTLQSTKSGGPLAGAWTVVQSLGDTGYELLSREVFEAVDAMVAGLTDITGVQVVAPPDSTLIALRTDESCDPFTICDEMSARDWYVQPQMSYAGQPATIHLSVSAATLPHVPDFLAALRDSVAVAVAQGPVAIDAGIAELIGSLDPAALSEEDFDGLLQAAGLIGAASSGEADLAVPERMGEVNAMLDLATPQLREALLVAFLDRLQRPTRKAAT